MIEMNTASAAMPRMRSASGTAEPSTNSAKVIVATPFGPNQAMKALPSQPTSRTPVSAVNTATGRATSSVNTAIPTAAQPSSNRMSKLRIAPNTRNTPSFTTSITSSERSLKHSATSGRQMPNAIAATKTDTNPFPSGGSTAAP